MSAVALKKQEVTYSFGAVVFSNMLQEGVGRSDRRRSPHPGTQAHRQICSLHAGEEEAPAPSFVRMKTDTLSLFI